MELKGKTAVVTGSAAGIGKALKDILLEKGCNVAGIDLHNEEKRAENEMSFVADISDAASVERIRDEIVDAFGSVDILINNAAIQTVASFDDTEISDFERIIQVNLVGTFICTKLFAEKMQEGDTIINMLSVHHNVPRLDKFGYDAAKAGEAMLTRETALALSDRKITCNGVAIGAVATPMNEDWIHDEAAVENTKKKIPLKWIASPEEIALHVVQVIEDFADCCTGTIFTIDGGRSLR